MNTMQANPMIKIVCTETPSVKQIVAAKQPMIAMIIEAFTTC